MNIYEGDPKIRIDEEGAEINFPGNAGQPEMEQGLENLTLISLLTRPNWEGNFYFSSSINNQIGSDYIAATEEPITLTNIETIRQATLKALANPAFGTITSTVTITGNSQRKNVIVIEPPGRDIQEIIVTRNGLNWLFQAEKGMN